MRASVALLGGAAVLAGVGLYAHPGEHAPAADRIVVVRGGTMAGPLARAAPVVGGVRPAGSPPAVAPSAADFGDPGVWATPAEFDQPEPAS